MQRLSSCLFCIPHRTLSLLNQSGSRSLHISSSLNAVALPHTATGPPPSAPVSATSEQIVRRQRRAELLKHGQNLRAGQSNPEDTLKKRFWKDVNVKTDSGMFFSPSMKDLATSVHLPLSPPIITCIHTHTHTH